MTYGYLNLNFVQHLSILASSVTGCVLIAAFSSLVCVSVGIMSLAVVINICAIISETKRYK